jgi:protein-S-isoprenylcysteine O-methyltransferase Ste14
MAWTDRVPSPFLVLLQFALMLVQLPGTWPPAPSAWVTVAAALLLASAAVGLAALAINRPGNFNIRPELKSGAQLARSGIYRWIRHPMYGAVLLATLGLVLLDPRPWRFAAWLALLGVLLVKAQREEHYLLQRFADYQAYRRRTWRLLPGIF